MSKHPRPRDAEGSPRRVGTTPAPVVGDPALGRSPLRDVHAPREVVKAKTVFEGAVWDIARESFHLDAGPEGPRPDDERPLRREVMVHPGAVAVLALRTHLTTVGPVEQVALVRQYRHPVGMELWEVPAGLRDVDGEPLHETAARELLEEADLEAGQWHTLVDFFSSPGGSSEAIRVFLARQVREVPEGRRHMRTDEEAAMPLAWVSLDEVLVAVLDGRVHSPTLAIAVLALQAHRAQGWRRLRPVDAPFVPDRPGTAVRRGR